MRKRKKADMDLPFDAEGFAAWLQEGFERSPIKTQKALADLAGSTPATISRHMYAANQTNTKKPSQPARDLVIKLAEILDIDVNRGLELAGRSRIPSASAWEEDFQILKDRLIAAGIDSMSDERRADLFADIVAIAADRNRRLQER